MDMTERTLHEAVNILRNTKMGATVKLVVSRQVLESSTSLMAAGVSTQMNGNGVGQTSLNLAMTSGENDSAGDHDGGGEEREVKEHEDETGEETTRRFANHHNESNYSHNEDNEREVVAAGATTTITAPESAKTVKKKASAKKQLLTFEIALNDTGSAGLGVSVKGRKKSKKLVS